MNLTLVRNKTSLLTILTAVKLRSESNEDTDIVDTSVDGQSGTNEVEDMKIQWIHLAVEAVMISLVLHKKVATRAAMTL
jgi:hypothetical protein